MTKAMRKAKSVDKSKSRKTRAKPKKTTAAKAPTPKKRARKPDTPGRVASFGASSESLAAAAPALSNASRTAVTRCVNSFLDSKRRGWNDDGQGNGRKMGADLNFPPNSIPAPVLTAIRTCLNNRQPCFTFLTTPTLVQTCAAGTVADMKFAIFQVATKC